MRDYINIRLKKSEWNYRSRNLRKTVAADCGWHCKKSAWTAVCAVVNEMGSIQDAA